MLKINQGVPANVFESKGGCFDPDLHFIVHVSEVEAVQAIIDAHLIGLVAFSLYSPFGCSCSLELQWDTTPEARQNMLNCRKAYMNLSNTEETDNGPRY